eukprot:2969885-Pleurochrysis_carterae.AAC.1
MIENPADCGDPDGAAWWLRSRDHAPLWQLPRMRAALAATGGAMVTAKAHAGALEAAACTHGEDGHAQVAHGRDAAGRARATAAAAYPPQMNAALAEALLAAPGAACGDASTPANSDQAHDDSPEIFSAKLLMWAHLMHVAKQAEDLDVLVQPRLNICPTGRPSSNMQRREESVFRRERGRR